MYLLFGYMTAVIVVAVLIYEILNFIPDLLLSTLNRMRNKSLSNDIEVMELKSFEPSLTTPNLETTLDQGNMEKNYLHDKFGRKL